MSRLLLATLVLLFPVAAVAQGGDAAYCADLGAMYQRYIVIESGQRTQRDAGCEIAIDRCRRGDYSGIPVLERKLRNAGFTLPPRR